jgi:hypothetical protein
MRLGSAVYQVENVRFGSKADIHVGDQNVRYVPQSDTGYDAHAAPGVMLGGQL